MDGERIEETPACGQWRMVTAAAGFSPQQSMCGAVAARRKAAVRRIGNAWTECSEERRPLPDSQVDARSRLVRPAKSECSGAGIGGARTADANPARVTTRLQPVRGYVVSAGLQTPARRGAGMLPEHGLHAGRRACKPADRSEAGYLATCPKNANGNPATGRYTGQTSCHGTNSNGVKPKEAEFVPPRDKTPCFSGCRRPATGHLYKYAISLGESEGRY